MAPFDVVSFSSRLKNQRKLIICLLTPQSENYGIRKMQISVIQALKINEGLVHYPVTYFALCD